MDAESNVPGAYHRTINTATIGSLHSATNGCRGNRTDSASREKNHYHLRLCHRRARETPGGRCHARHAAGTKQSAARGDHAHQSVLSNAGDVATRSNESGAGSALSGLSGLRQNGTTTRPIARSDVIRSRGHRTKCATGRNGGCRKRGAAYHSVAAKPEISASLATG